MNVKPASPNGTRPSASTPVALIVRALSDLGYRPDKDRAPAVGGTLRLKGAAIWATIELNWSRDGTVTLRSEGRSTRFVPLLDLVGPDDRPEEAVARWSAVEAEITSPSVIVHLAPFRVMAALPGVAAQSLTSAGADGPNGRALVTAVPVTPLETTSLERVARAVADAVRTPALEAYPAVVGADNPLPRRIISSLLDAGIPDPSISALFFLVDHDVLRLRRRLTPSETSKFGVWVKDRLASARGTGWERDYTSVIERIPDLITDAGERANRIMVCPACGQRAEFERDGPGAC